MIRTTGRWGGREDPKQLHIDWLAIASGPNPADLPTGKAGTSPPLVLRLPWDFKNTFPQPTPEAIDAGIIADEDATLESVRAIHDEHAREMRTALHDYSAVLDARRRGVDPATGRTPTTPEAKSRLQKLFESEPARLEHWFQTLLDTYETAFGKAVRAWDAGVEVVGPSSHADRVKSQGPRTNTPEQIASSSARHRIIARLPVPRPLPSAVAAGHFGQEEDGRNVRPGPHEVRAITEQFAETLVELLESRRFEQFQSGLVKYAESFGQQAADQLGAYAQRQANLQR